jgi:sporulation protein YlmC with PRC-barrel domain
MRLTDLWAATVKTLDGEKLGRVHEIHAEGGRIVALTCGPGSFIERLTARKHGRRVPWECVVRIAKGEIFVASDPPRRMPKKKSNASRNRQGTRRPSAPRSKR